MNTIFVVYSFFFSFYSASYFSQPFFLKLLSSILSTSVASLTDMAFLPGICAEMPTMSFRLFLGTLPSKSVEHKLLVDCLPVHYWFSSRKRVKEQANEFLEMDMASCDPELMLRYCSIPFVRRHLFHELVDKQLSLLETGKAISLPDAPLVRSLEECIGVSSSQLEWEKKKLERPPFFSLVNRRVDSSGVSMSDERARSNDLHTHMVEPCDLLYLMRQWERSHSFLGPGASSVHHCEKDEIGEQDLEMRARAFLCKSRVQKSFFQLASLFSLEDPTGMSKNGEVKGGKEEPLSSSSLVLPFEKKELKLFQRQYPKDVVKVGTSEKMRPGDVTAYYRFMGERLFSKRPPREGGDKGKKSSPASFFYQALMGNVFQKIATHPMYLQSISMYWARECGLDPASSLSTMPLTLAKAVCAKQRLFPAMKLHAQFLYTSPDIARRQWRSDYVIPLLRLFPLLGKRMAEEMAASLVVDSIWASARISEEEENPVEEIRLREIKKRMEAAADAFEHRPDEIHALIVEGAKVRCTPPSPSCTTATP